MANQKISATLPTRKLIVVAEKNAAVRTTERGIHSAKSADISSLAKLLEKEKLSMTPLFGINEGILAEQAAAASPNSDGIAAPDLSVYYEVNAPDKDLERLAATLLKNEHIAGAYIQPIPEMAGLPEEFMLNPSPAPPVSPDFSARQTYLDPAPGGIDARYAWSVSGGRGWNVRIVDVEGAWQFAHEDLAQMNGGLVAGTQTTDVDWRNHGTAVMGEIGGDHNGIGVMGICPDARLAGSTIFGAGNSIATAIVAAANTLVAGDIILIELHTAGPRFGFAGRADQLGYIAMEWFPDVFDAVRYATNRGIIVVSAAGNGAENLSDPLYDVRPAGFPATWVNPFRRTVGKDSGSVIVGAGAPPPGTHGRNWGPDRSRLGFSNYGSCVDAQGWGREVTTLAYGDLQGGINETQWYTDTFAGTSSASPIIVGALGCVQGYLRANGRIPMSPARARDLLRATGSPQQDGPNGPIAQRIGNRPNLRQMIGAVSGQNTWLGVQFTGTLAPNQTMRYYTWGWPAHWHMLWTVMPTTPVIGAPEISYDVDVERATDAQVTYWITVTNLTAQPIQIEGRYAVLGW